MYCQCCQGKNFWLSEKELKSINSQELQNQADQAKEFLSDGLDIYNQGNEREFICDEMDEEYMGECAAIIQSLKYVSSSSLASQDLNSYRYNAIGNIVVHKNHYKEMIEQATTVPIEEMEEEEDDMMCSYDQTQASVFHGTDTRIALQNLMVPLTSSLGKSTSHQETDDGLSDIFSDAGEDD